jgi:hypothetical protein
VTRLSHSIVVVRVDAEVAKVDRGGDPDAAQLEAKIEAARTSEQAKELAIRAGAFFCFPR